MNSARWFTVACLFEGGLLVVAGVVGWVVGLDPWSSWAWEWRALGWGLAGVVPPLFLLGWVARSPWRPMAEIRDFLDRVARPWFGGWAWWQLALLSMLAGLGEEVLFRGIVQAGVAQWVGPSWALLVAAVLFGLVHRITPLYAVLAGIMGVWLGLIWGWSGSLVAPVAAHAIYDYLALTFWLRFRSAPSASTAEGG